MAGAAFATTGAADGVVSVLVEPSLMFPATTVSES